MAFPPKVAEDALVKCGRRCCLCHKFCRTDIEIHHIIKAFATIERPANMENLKEAASMFIGLSNGLYVYKGGDSGRRLDENLKWEDRIRELLEI